jgi:hypothetical protein
VFPHRGEKTRQTGILSRAQLGAKTLTNPLLYLKVAQVTLRLVVTERNPLLKAKRLHLLLAFIQQQPLMSLPLSRQQGSGVDRGWPPCFLVESLGKASLMAAARERGFLANPSDEGGLWELVEF